MTSDLDLLVARMKSAGALRVYKVNEVPTSPGDAYAVLALDTGQRASTRASGESGARLRRLSVQLNGRTDDGVQDMAEYADAAFYDQTLTEFDTDPFCVRELTVGPIRDPDDRAWLYILHTYRFTT